MYVVTLLKRSHRDHYLKCVTLKWRKVPPLKTRKMCYCGGNIASMTTLTLLLTLPDPHDAKPDLTRPSLSEFD